MNAKDFVNYLKGGIELGQLKSLDSKAFNIIQENLSVIKNEHSTEFAFCTWLQGVLDSSENQQVNEKSFMLITQKLDELINNKKLQQYIENDVTTTLKPTVGTSGRKC